MAPATEEVLPMAKKVESAAPETGVGRWRGAIDGKQETGSKKTARRGGVDKKQAALLVFTLALCVASAIGFTPLSERISQGFDVQGGVNVTLAATKPDGSKPTTEDMSSTASIVESRVDALGVPGVVVRKEADSIVLQVPGSVDASSVVEDVSRVGHLELVRIDDIGDAEALSKIMAGGSGVELEAGSYTAFLDGSSVTRAEVARANGADGYAVDVTFDSEGAQKLSDVTAELAASSGRIAVVVDGVVRSAPAVQSRIEGGAVSISGGFTEGEAKALKASLDFGSLPVELAEAKAAPAAGAFGEGGLSRVVLAFFASTAAVVVFLLFVFRGLGILVPSSLAVEGVLNLGALALLSRLGPFALTGASLVATALAAALSVGSTVLLLDRVREQAKSGKKPKTALSLGLSRGIRGVVLGEAAIFAAALALSFVLGGAARSFLLALAAGMACDAVALACFKAPALRLLWAGPAQRRPGFWGVPCAAGEGIRHGRPTEGGE